MLEQVLERLWWLGHSSFIYEGDSLIYFDPFVLPRLKPADIILVSHDHPQPLGGHLQSLPQPLYEGIGGLPQPDPRSQDELGGNWILEILHLADCPLRKAKDD